MGQVQATMAKENLARSGEALEEKDENAADRFIAAAQVRATLALAYFTAANEPRSAVATYSADDY